MKKLICIILCAIFSKCLLAFEVDGFYSNMSIEQFKKISNSQIGFEIAQLKDNSYIIGNLKDDKIYGIFKFCNNSLMTYTKVNVDFKKNYANFLNELIFKYGQPIISVNSIDDHTTALGSKTQIVQMIWKNEKEFINLSNIPEKNNSTSIIYTINSKSC